MRESILGPIGTEYQALIPGFVQMAAAAIILGSLMTLWLWRHRTGRSQPASDLLFWGILGLLLGAKLFYFLQFGFPPSFSGWWSLSGWALYGGLSGALAAWWIHSRARRCSLAPFLDCAAPALGLGLFLGRIGCFLAGCNWGHPARLPWAVSFPPGSPAYEQQLSAGLIAPGAAGSLPVHPTQLYEAVFGLSAMLVLLAWIRRRPARPSRLRGPDGTVFAAGALAYAVFRFGSEFLRADAQGLHPFGLFTFSQSVSLLLAAGALAFLIRSGRQPGRSLPSFGMLHRRAATHDGGCP